MKNIRTIDLHQFNLEKGKQQALISLSYQIFGLPVGTAPIIVVNHSLTGNSNVCGRNGWWKDIIGENKTINTEAYTIIAFNIPGNGYNENPEDLIPNYRDFTLRDIANLFWEGLFKLKVNSMFALIGGGLGGAIAWEMAVLQPKRIEHLIPIATDWKATNRIIATVLLQDQLLNNSEDPLVDARYYAGLYFKNPEFVNQLFCRNNLDSDSIETIETCVSQNNQYQISGYRLMNFIQKYNDICRHRNNFDSVMKTIKATIHIVGIDTNGMYSIDENQNTFVRLQKIGSNVYYHEMESNFGNNAFVKETKKMASYLQPIFNTKQISIRSKFNYYYINA